MTCPTCLGIQHGNVLKRLALYALCAFLAYYTVAYWVYSFRHPDQTDTRRVLNTVDVLTWQ